MPATVPQPVPTRMLPPSPGDYARAAGLFAGVAALLLRAAQAGRAVDPLELVELTRCYEQGCRLAGVRE